MDKTLLKQPKESGDKVLDSVPTGLSLDVSLNMDEREDFTEQQIVGLPDKIPLVKPYFKKKHGQRKIDAKCLHRALEDPILTTLLTADTLVTGDGVFVSHRQPSRTPGSLCAAAVVKQTCIGQVCLKDAGTAAAVTGLMGHDADQEMTDDTTVELEETERPKLTELDLQMGSNPKTHCFQLKSALRPHDVGAATVATMTIMPPTPDASLVAPPPPLQEKGIKTSDLFASEALQGTNCLPIKDSGGPPPSLHASQLSKEVIFQDKSEEASLDLVFELLTQLQYHTHQADLVPICVDFLQGLCVYGSDCAHHHTVLPYHWQIHRSSTQTWQSIADDAQEQLERLYCNPDNEQVRLKFQGKWRRGKQAGKYTRRQRMEK